jgi:hypothetical protein
MFAANVFTIIDSQDMQERNRLGPVALTPRVAQGKMTRPEDRSSRRIVFWLGHSRRPGMMRGDE